MDNSAQNAQVSSSGPDRGSHTKSSARCARKTDKTFAGDRDNYLDALDARIKVELDDSERDAFKKMLETRTTADANYLGDYIAALLQRNSHYRELGKPLLVEIKRRFKVMFRGKLDDGCYNSINGCRSFAAWCDKQGIKRRNAYYLLNGRPSHKAKYEKKTETDSLLKIADKIVNQIRNEEWTKKTRSTLITLARQYEKATTKV